MEYEVRRGRDVGQAIAELRRRLGLTQEQVSDRVGIAENYVSKIESGRTVTLLEHELRILRRLGARVVIELPDVADVSSDEVHGDDG